MIYSKIPSNGIRFSFKIIFNFKKPDTRVKFGGNHYSNKNFVLGNLLWQLPKPHNGLLCTILFFLYKREKVEFDVNTLQH